MNKKTILHEAMRVQRTGADMDLWFKQISNEDRKKLDKVMAEFADRIVESFKPVIHAMENLANKAIPSLAAATKKFSVDLDKAGEIASKNFRAKPELCPADENHCGECLIYPCMIGQPNLTWRGNENTTSALKT